MSNWTNAGENMLADFIRGQSMVLPANFTLGLLSAASDTAFTENAWTGYARQTVVRSLANWSATQGAGTVVASAGTSHQTSNNNAVDFGTVGSGGSGTINFVGLFKDTALIAYAPLANPIAFIAGDPINFAAGSIVFTLGITGGLSDYASNRLIDHIWRAQTFTWPTTTQVRLLTTAPTNAGGGAEVVGGSYAPQPLTANMTFWSGTQGAGTTTASTGTGGRISNNAPINFPVPTANWGTVSHFTITDGANLLMWQPMAAARSVIGGGPSPLFAADKLSITIA